MNKRSKSVLCVLLAATLLSGCSGNQSEQTDSINTVDINNTTTASSEDTVPSVEAPDTTESAAPETTESTNASTKTTTENSPDEIVIPDEIIIPDDTEPSVTQTTTSATTTERDDPPESEATDAPDESTAATEDTSSVSEDTTIPEETTTTPASPAPEDEPVELPTDFGTNDYDADNYGVIKGVWISYLEYLTLMQGKTEAQFRENIGDAFDNCVDIGLNTVYVHARSHGDAYYESELFPWSKYASGTLDKSPGYDPFEIIIEEAHDRDLSVQAWINPLRMCSASDIGSYGDYTVYDWYDSSSTNGEYIVEVSGYYYLNPAYDEVIEFVADGAAEIVAKYDVDGLHIDDYFYPTTDVTFDEQAYLDSSYTSLSQFRLDNSSELVEAIYDAVKDTNPTALFSVSCQGSIENNYNHVFADVERWCTEAGYVDYIVPQIYYGFENSTQPYITCLERWDELASDGEIPLVVGLAAYKIGTEDVWAGEGKYEWVDDDTILARQLELAMECASYGGISLYSYKSIFGADDAVAEQVWAEINGFTDILD